MKNLYDGNNPKLRRRELATEAEARRFLKATGGTMSIYGHDVIPEGFYNAIKYGAAGLAFLSSARYAQAQVMESIFADRLGVGRVTVDRGKTPSYYDSRL